MTTCAIHARPDVGGVTMSFGKRRGGPSGAQQPASASASAPAGLPGAQIIGPNLLHLGTEKPNGPAARIVRFLLDTYTDGVNIETILSAAGALAGFAAQEGIWEGF